ncbi:nucleolar protein dao-5 [Thalassophryne amazonica]|uniref:nucleolar protein dao-5 n=1 Tax=Thalassophryne amazonica TaxID=390379 RepID=UPI001472680C|nr:nucleolar protein dao-5 [Thalassophryne amazonica]
MDIEHPALRRPKRKLCYFTKKESPSIKCSGKVTSGDVDRMFDDLEFTSDEDFDVLLPCPLNQSHESQRGLIQSKAPSVPQQGHQPETSCQVVAISKGLHSAKKTASQEIDVGIDSHFKKYRPVMMSSPIEGNMGEDHQDHEKVQVVSPVLLDTEDIPRDNPAAVPKSIHKQLSSNIKEQSSDYSEMESPPSKVVFRKSKICNQNIQGNEKSSVSVLSQEPETQATEKNLESGHRQYPQAVMCSHVRKEGSTFLQKLRDARQPKPSCSRKSVVPVKQPNVQPDTEDIFLILEEEAPSLFSIPKLLKETKGSTVDEEKSSDKQTKDRQPVIPREQQQSEKATVKRGCQAVSQKKTKRKGKREDLDISAVSTAQRNSVKTRITENNAEKYEVPTTEDLPACNLIELDNSSKMVLQHPKISFKDGNKLDGQNFDRTSHEMNKEKSTVEVEKEAPKSFQVRTAKESKVKATLRKPKSVKRTQKEIQTSGAVKESVLAESLEEQCQEQHLEKQADAEDQCSPPTKEKIVLAKGKAKKSKLSAGSGASSSEDDQVFGKRKRKPPGQWWMSGHQEETKIKDNHLLSNMSKKNIEVQAVEASSPGTFKKQPQIKKASCDLDKENPNLEVDKKAIKSSPVKRTKSSKEKENVKTSKAKSLKKTRKQFQASDAIKGISCVETPEEQQQGGNMKGNADDDDDQCPPSAEEISEAQAAKGLLNVKPEPSSFKDDQVLSKRKRKLPGQWWLSSSQSADEAKGTYNQLLVKKSKENLKTQRAAGRLPVKVEKDAVLKKRNQKQTEPSTQSSTLKEKKNDVNLMEEQEQQDIQEHSHRDHGLQPVFPREYHYISSKKLCGTPASHRRTQEQVKVREKRIRKPPCNWWQADDGEDIESVSAQPQQTKAKERKPHKETKRHLKQNGSPAPNMASSLGGSPELPLKQKSMSGLKSVKRCLAAYKKIFSSGAGSPAVANSRGIHQKYNDITGGPDKDFIQIHVFEDAGESRITENCPSNKEFLQNEEIGSQSLSLTSGPCSLTELQHHQEMDVMISVLPSSRLAFDALCGPPLKRLVLRDDDKANVAEWLNHLWASTINNGSEITLDHFDWYTYQGRAIGFQVDLYYDSFCNGKILLGSHAKKPLWVDHTATTVYNVFTSSVKVTINCQESCYNPGQSFVVPCGNAYSIQNLAAMPAVLYFNRMLAESP